MNDDGSGSLNTGGGLERVSGQGDRGERKISREDYAKAAAEIKKAVEAGKVSETDAKARLDEMRKMIGRTREDAGKRDVDWEAIKERIEGAVKAGKMTREEADAKYAEIRKGMAGRGDAKRPGDRDPAAVYRAAEKEIKAAIAAGKITEEQGKERLAGLKQHLAQEAREGEAKKDVDWEAIKKRIEGAVKNGDMTREEADTKYKAIRKRMAGARQR